MNPQIDEPNGYRVTGVERYTAIGLAVVIAIFCMAVIWRTEPIDDPNKVVALRILLSMMCGVLGGIIPGFLNVDFSVSGLAVRAAGGLGLAVLTYVYTPQVLTNLKPPTEVQLERFQSGDAKVAFDNINGYWMTPEKLEEYTALDPPAKSKIVSDWLNQSGKVNSVMTIAQFLSDLHSCDQERRCEASVLCGTPKLFDEADNFVIFFGDYLKTLSNVGYKETVSGARYFITCDCIVQLRADRCKDHPSMCAAEAICPA